MDRFRKQWDTGAPDRDSDVKPHWKQDPPKVNKMGEKTLTSKERGEK